MKQSKKSKKLKKRRNILTSDKVLSAAAIFISFLTLYIFIRQTNIIERQSHLSVMPYLNVETSNNREENSFAIDLINHGVGPAIIENVAIHHNGKEYDLQLSDFMNRYLPGMDSVYIINRKDLFKGQAVRSGDAINLMTVGGSRRSYEDFLRVMERLGKDKFDYVIQYRSIYGHRWKIHVAPDTHNQVPETLDD
jgi:hypothetical protein